MPSMALRLALVSLQLNVTLLGPLPRDGLQDEDSLSQLLGLTGIIKYVSYEPPKTAVIYPCNVMAVSIRMPA